MKLVFIPGLTVMHRVAAAMQEIRSTVHYLRRQKRKLKGALEQYTENFVNTRPEK